MASDTATMSGDATFGEHALAPDAPRLGAHRVRRFDERLLAHRQRLPHVRRAKPGIITSEMARIAFWRSAPSAPATASASTSGGKLARPSMIRMRVTSVPPPRNPASSPSGTATRSARPTIWNPERNDTRAP